MIALGVLALCIVVVFIITRGWVAVVDAMGKRLIGRFRKKEEPKVWHTLNQGEPENSK